MRTLTPREMKKLLKMLSKLYPNVEITSIDILTEALENASSEDVVEYILDHAREELESMFMEDFLDWVKEEVGYAYDDKDYKAFGLLEVEHD